MKNIFSSFSMKQKKKNNPFVAHCTNALKCLKAKQ